MKKILKKSAILLASTLCMVGCNETELTAISPISEDVPHYVSNTTHDIVIRERNLAFVTNGETDYQIIIPQNNTYASEAALFITNHVKKATGGEIKVVTYTDSLEYTKYSKYIVLGVDELSTKAGVTKTNKDIKTTGYNIQTHDDSVFVFVNHNYGFQQAAYCFLKRVVGYDRISKDICLYSRDASTLPEMNIVEVPDFQIRTQSNKITTAYSYETGFTTLNDVFYTSNKIKFVHNSFDWVPLSNKTEHPKWFANDSSQICYTAGGDEAEFDALIDYVYQGMVEALEDKPDCTRFAFTIEDNRHGCNCEKCQEISNKYGASSAPIVIFTNKLDDRVQEYLQAKADAENKPKRKMEITFFAYNRVEKPPVKWDEDAQKWVPTAPEMVLNPNVSVFIAPIGANYQESFWSDYNVATRDILDGWSEICDSINYWLYETNFSHYLYPYNSFYNMSETYRYTVQKKATYLFNEGQHNQGAATAFSKFKEYFNQVAEIDVNTPYVPLMNHFFDEYFKEGREPMYKMFDEIQQHMNFLKNEHYGQLSGQIYDNIARSDYWPKQLLERWIGYTNEAMELINKYQYTNYELYKILRDNITLESIFPRYALINHHSGKFSSSEVQKMRKSFYEDCIYLGVSRVSEGTTIDTLKETWGL